MATTPSIQVKRSARMTSPKGTTSYPHVFKASAYQGEGDPKFSVALMLPKATNAEFIAKVRAAQEAALADLYGKKLPQNLERWGIQDGDDLDDPVAKGHWIIKASNKARPAVVDASGTEIIDELAVYGGCFGRINFCAKAYGSANKGGVTLELNVYQKIADGKPFGGAEKAKQAALAEMGAYEDEAEQF